MMAGSKIVVSWLMSRNARQFHFQQPLEHVSQQFRVFLAALALVVANVSPERGLVVALALEVNGSDHGFVSL